MIEYIVGTDTDVGKSYYGRQLAREGHRVIKPIETGKSSFADLNESDCYQYAHLQSLPLSEVNQYFFSEPVSPHFASAIDNCDIEIDKLKHFISQHDSVVVELAGGLMVPIRDKYTQLDLIKETSNAAVILVIGNKLGCLNHGLMTLELLKQSAVKVSKVLVNNLSVSPTPLMENNINTIRAYLPANVTLEIIS